MEPERRKSNRESATMAAACGVRGVAYRARLSDLSHTGCRAEMARDVMRPGERVLIQIGRLLAVPAEVRWVSHGAAGIEFANPLHGAMLCKMAGRRGGSGRPH